MKKAGKYPRNLRLEAGHLNISHYIVSIVHRPDTKSLSELFNFASTLSHSEPYYTTLSAVLRYILLAIFCSMVYSLMHLALHRIMFYIQLCFVAQHTCAAPGRVASVLNTATRIVNILNSALPFRNIYFMYNCS